jgi:hypothetical protein
MTNSGGEGANQESGAHRSLMGDTNWQKRLDIEWAVIEDAFRATRRRPHHTVERADPDL